MYATAAYSKSRTIERRAASARMRSINRTTPAPSAAFDQMRATKVRLERGLSGRPSVSRAPAYAAHRPTTLKGAAPAGDATLAGC